MDEEFWDSWLRLLILMHEGGYQSLDDFQETVFEDWRDLCTMRDFMQIVRRVLWPWGFAS